MEGKPKIAKNKQERCTIFHKWIDRYIIYFYPTCQDDPFDGNELPSHNLLSRWIKRKWAFWLNGWLDFFTYPENSQHNIHHTFTFRPSRERTSVINGPGPVMNSPGIVITGPASQLVRLVIYIYLPICVDCLYSQSTVQYWLLTRNAKGNMIEYGEWIYTVYLNRWE